MKIKIKGRTFSGGKRLQGVVSLPAGQALELIDAGLATKVGNAKKKKVKKHDATDSDSGSSEQS